MENNKQFDGLFQQYELLKRQLEVCTSTKLKAKLQKQLQEVESQWFKKHLGGVANEN